MTLADRLGDGIDLFRDVGFVEFPGENLPHFLNIASIHWAVRDRLHDHDVLGGCDSEMLAREGNSLGPPDGGKSDPPVRDQDVKFKASVSALILILAPGGQLRAQAFAKREQAFSVLGDEIDV